MAAKSGELSVVQVGGSEFRVRPSFKSLKVIGRGSYGVVVSCVDGSSSRKLAVKRIKPVSAHSSDAKHVLREIRCMRLLGAHPNIVGIADLYGDLNELYIVMELMDSDLHRIIQSSQPLTEAHHRFFMYQLVRGVKYMHDYHIIHRDLKPGNLLVTRSCELKITDFGLARRESGAREGVLPKAVDDDDDDDDDEMGGHRDPMTQHVVTRWYRPPELMLTPDGLYTNAVDVWSVGCVLAELLGRKPLFPGKNFVHQLQLIFGVIGAPRIEEIDNVKNRQAKKFLDSVKFKPKIPFAELFPDHPVAADLLEEILVFAPHNRSSAAQLLAKSAFFQNLSYAQHPLVDPPATPCDFAFEEHLLPHHQAPPAAAAPSTTTTNTAASAAAAKKHASLATLKQLIAAEIRRYSGAPPPRIVSAPKQQQRHLHGDSFDDPGDVSEDDLSPEEQDLDDDRRRSHRAGWLGGGSRRRERSSHAAEDETPPCSARASSSSSSSTVTSSSSAHHAGRVVLVAGAPANHHRASNGPPPRPPSKQRLERLGAPPSGAAATKKANGILAAANRPPAIFSTAKTIPSSRAASTANVIQHHASAASSTTSSSSSSSSSNNSNNHNTNTNSTSNNKRRPTIPVSPKFSKMSWQR